jgi:hypothetical protein
VICPVQMAAQGCFALPAAQIKLTTHPSEGGSRTSRTRDGMRWTRRRRLSESLMRQTRQSGSMRGSVETGITARPLRHCQTKGAETDTPDLTSTAPHSYSTVKIIAQGRPVDPGYTWGDYRVLFTNAHGPRVRRAPGFRCALCFSRGVTVQLGRIAPLDTETHARTRARGAPWGWNSPLSTISCINIRLVPQVLGRNGAMC